MVSRWTRHGVHAFLLVFAITGIAHLELHPFSGFRLFSELRGRERHSFEVRAVTADGSEVKIDFGRLPLGYRNSTRLIPGLDDLEPGDRDAICDAWTQPLRDEGERVELVRIYEVVRSVRPDAPPPIRTVALECGTRP